VDDQYIEGVFDDIEVVRSRADREDVGRDLEDAAGRFDVGQPGRAAYLAAAAESWTASGGLDDALRCAEAAVADGGETMVGAHAVLIDVLLARDELDRARACAHELRSLLAADDASDTAPEYVAEAFEEAGLLQEAHRWFNLATREVDPDSVEVSLAGELTALFGRRRVRQRLGLAEDRLDQAAERARQRILPGLGGGASAAADAVMDVGDDLYDEVDNEVDDGVDDMEDLLDAMPAGRIGRLAVLHWPAGEFERFVERWPDLAEGYGGDPEGHRRQTEEELRELSLRGAPVAVALGDLDEYLAFAADRGVDPMQGTSRARYAAEIGRTERVVTWPPGRNEPCWCGSGMKYKRCCGRPG
jgi:hypothetical protein